MRRHFGIMAVTVGLAYGLSDPANVLDGKGTAAAATVSSVVENVVARFGGVTVTIKRMEVAGNGSSGADIVALLDRTSPKPLVEQLRGLSSPSIVMPDVVVEIAVGPGTVREAFRDVRLIDVVQGRIGAASLGRTTLSVSDTGRPFPRGETGEITARNVDLLQFARLLTEPRPPAGETARPLFDSLAIDNIDIVTARDFRIEVGRIAAGRFMARALTVPLGELPGRLATIDNGPQPRREKEKSEILIAEDLAASLGIGALDVRDVRLSNPRGSEEIRFARIGLRDMFDDTLGELTVEGFAMPDARRPLPPPSTAGDARGAASAGTPAFRGQAFTLASVRGLDFRSAVAQLNAILNSGHPPEPGSLFRIFLPVFDRAILLGLHIDAPDTRASDGRASPKLELARFEIAGGNFVHGIPGTLLIALQGLSVDAAFVQQLGLFPRLDEFGLAKLEVPTARFDLAWNEAKREIALKALSADVTDLGVVTVTGTIANADHDLFSDNLLLEQAAGLATVFKSLDVSFRDAGLLDRLVASVAKRQHVSDADTRAKMVQEVAVRLPSDLGGGRAAKAIGNALAKFVAQPRTLHIAATSPDGLGFPDVATSGGPAGILERLDVTAAANE